MNILFFDMGSYTYRDASAAMERLGHSVDTVYYHFANIYEDDFFSPRFEQELRKKKYDVVFSINFFPLVALVCKNKNIPYVSWSYDSPLDERLSEYFDYDTNYIFLFDRVEVQKYLTGGHDRVFHMPLAVNTDRLDALKLNRYSATPKMEISFVGKIYESTLGDLMMPANDYVKGYVDALMQAQLGLYGCNILEETISDDVLESLNDSYAALGQCALRLNRRGLAYAISTQITHFERTFLLEELAERRDVHIYTLDRCELSAKVHKHGPVKYYSEMNEVFVNSKLNLCPTLRSIASGIPLRALDIMGAGGNLVSNYQPELAEYFTDGESVIMYESIEDAIAKAEYYLEHDEERIAIAVNGYEQVKKCFGYEDKISEMLGMVSL